MGFLVAAALLSPPSARATSVTIDLPCEDTGGQPGGNTGASGLRLCKWVLNGKDPIAMLNPTPGASPLPDPGVLPLLKDRFTKQLAALYGYYPDSPATPGASTPPPFVWHTEGLHLDLDSRQSPPGVKFTSLSRNACNIVENDVLRPEPAQGIGSEINKPLWPGSIANSCGNPISIRLDLGITVEREKAWSCPGHDMHYTCINGVAPVAYLDITQPAHASQENGFLQGAYISALSCFYQAKVNEIRDTRKLEIEDINGVESECRAEADYYLNITHQAASVYQGFYQQMKDKGLDGTAQYADIVNCKQTWDNDAPNVQNPAVSSLRQQAQQLCGARAAIETSFVRLAECQIFALSKAAWLNVVVDHLPDYWSGVLQEKVANPCGRFCADFVKGPEAFKVPAEIKTSVDLKDKLSGGWSCAKCNLSCLDFLHGGCHDGPGEACDASEQCKRAYISPYQGYVSLERDPTPTQQYANEDASWCANSCYLYGTRRGEISPSAPGNRRRVPRLDKTISVPSSGDIPSYLQAIKAYLEKQWPRNPTRIQDCARTVPVTWLDPAREQRQRLEAEREFPC